MHEDRQPRFEGPNAHQDVPLAPRIAAIAVRQGGHITTAQLHALGLSRRAIQHQAVTGALIRVHHGIYAVGHLPTNPHDRACGALLATGPRSALLHGSAAAHWGVIKSWPQNLELISAADTRPRGLIVHRCGTLLRRDIRTVAPGLRVTSPARTALDVAPRLTHNRLTRAVNDLRHIHRLTVAQLRDVAARNPRHPGTTRINELIGTSQAQHTRSGLEDAFLRLTRRHRLPTPQINVHVAGIRVDAYFPDHGLIVELDGEITHGHDWRPAFEADRAQTADIMLQTGFPTIRFTDHQVRRHGGRTATKLKGILARRARELSQVHTAGDGWAGSDPPPR